MPSVTFTVSQQKRVQRFYDVMGERERCDINRQKGLPRSQWTQDKVLSTKKFTSVKRTNDFTSRHLRSVFKTEAVSCREKLKGSAHFTHRLLTVMFLTLAVWRLLGSCAVMTGLGFIYDWNGHSEHGKARVMRCALVMGTGAFTRAYNPSKIAWGLAHGGHGQKFVSFTSKMLGRIDGLYASISELVDVALRERSLERVAEELKHVPYFGTRYPGESRVVGFTAKEFIEDISMCVTCIRWEDAGKYCGIGKGAVIGLNIIIGRDEKAQPPSEVLRAELRAVFRLRHEMWPRTKAPMPDLVLHDIQFWLCEYQKYVHAKAGHGVTRRFEPRECPRCTNGLHRACTCGRTSRVAQRLQAARAGGRARATSLSKTRRSKIAKAAAQKRHKLRQKRCLVAHGGA